MMDSSSTFSFFLLIESDLPGVMPITDILGECECLTITSVCCAVIQYVMQYNVTKIAM